jgi:cytochrome c oxidase subunit 1
MMGGVLFALIAGMHHWWPKITGRMYNESTALVAWVVVFVGYNLTFFPQFIAGSRGMPRRYHQYVPEFELWNQLSTIGSYVFGLGLFIVLGYLLQSLRSGAKAPANPWGGMTLEWEALSPPVEHNFSGPVVCKVDPYDFPEIETSVGHAH